MPNVSDGQLNGKTRDNLQKLHGQTFTHGIDVSIEDVSDTKNGQEQSSRVSSYKTQTKGTTNRDYHNLLYYLALLVCILYHSTQHFSIFSLKCRSILSAIIAKILKKKR